MKFGAIKNKLLNKLTESYANENKTEIKKILTLVKENKDFSELYLFYEEIENKYIEDKETAKLYVETVEAMLSQPFVDQKNLNEFCKSLDEKLGSVEINENEVYSLLDALSTKDTLKNIENKVVAKKKLVEHLTTKKEIKESKTETVVNNENLLHAILANNFNVLYSNTLSESEQTELKNILSIPYSELLVKTTELKENILERANTLINESTDSDFQQKLNMVINQVHNMEPSKYNYYKLNELKNGLN